VINLQKKVSFIGNLDSTIVLNVYSDKIRVFKTDLSLKKLDTVLLKFPSSFNTTINIYKDIDPFNVYCSNPLGDITVFNGLDVGSYKVRDAIIDRFVAVSTKTIIARARHNYDKESNRAFVKLKLSDKMITNKRYSLPKQENGFFANDGQLSYDHKNGRLLYMYFYRGEFLCLDTNLNLLYKGKSIDTVTSVKIKTAIINLKATKTGGSIKQITQASPPSVVSRYMTVSSGRLYILSALKSDKEKPATFATNHAVDVYDLKNGRYLHSFYIPKYKGIKLNQFQIKGKSLIGIYDTELVCYDFIEKRI